MQHAAVWGVAAALLHFIPYVGPVLIFLASGMAGFSQFRSLLGAPLVDIAKVICDRVESLKPAGELLGS